LKCCCCVAAVGCIVAKLDVPSLSYVSSEDSVVVRGKHLAFNFKRGRGWGTCALLYRCCGESPRCHVGRRKMFGVMRRVLPLLATSKIVFDVTRWGGTLLVMSLCLQTLGISQYNKTR